MGLNLRDFFKTIDPKQVAENNKKEYEQYQLEYNDFITKFNTGKCYLCNKELIAVNEKAQCLHELLLPTKIAKKRIESILSEYNFERTINYFRWVSNIEATAVNVNDLKDEMDSGKEFEITIAYRDVEWAFSCGKGDLAGHTGAAGDFPHFHMQITCLDKIIVSFNDFHIPFSQYDLFNIRCRKEIPDLIHEAHPSGYGMQDILGNEKVFQNVYETLSVDGDHENAQFNVRTIIVARNGRTITDKEINDLFEERERTGIPISRLAHKLNADVQVIVMPGDGVVEMRKRNKRRKSNG